MTAIIPQKIGLIGGLSWLSTELYYREINKTVNNALGGHSSANIAIESLDFEPIQNLMHTNNWTKISDILIERAQCLQKAQADFFLIGCNTVHKIADSITQKVSLPFIHILEPVTEELLKNNIDTVALLGTTFTMGDNCHREYFLNNYGINCIVPDVISQRHIHQIIFNQLCHNKVSDDSKDYIKSICNKLILSGAKAVVLACTELGFIIKQNEFNVPVLDTTILHAKHAALRSLSDISTIQGKSIYYHEYS